jgi:hypothetical protein
VNGDYTVVAVTHEKLWNPYTTENDIFWIDFKVHVEGFWKRVMQTNSFWGPPLG